MANVQQYADRLHFICSGLNLADMLTKANMTKIKLKQLFEPGNFAENFLKNNPPKPSEVQSIQYEIDEAAALSYYFEIM
jgi:hypothetical protein